MPWCSGTANTIPSCALEVTWCVVRIIYILVAGWELWRLGRSILSLIVAGIRSGYRERLK
jgi:hypothetical protein